MAQPREERNTSTAPRNQRSDTQQSVPMERERGTRSGALQRRDPFQMLNAMRQQMDRLFGFSPLTSLFGDFGSDIDRSLWAPQIETYEKEGKLHICADLPGMTKDDVQVNVNDNMLTIEGERKQEQRDEARGWSERSYGRFFRSIPLPEGVNGENAKASFKDGVLDVAFDAPKKEQKQGKSINIE